MNEAIGSAEEMVWHYNGDGMFHGMIGTMYGIVVYYAPEHLILHFAWQGKWHRRSYAKRYSLGWRVRLARSFAKEVAEAHGEP